MKRVVSALISHIEGTDKEDDYTDALLDILTFLEGTAGGIEERIEEIEDLLGIVREKIDLFSQKERAEMIEGLIVRLLELIEDVPENQERITALENVLNIVKEIKASIEAKLN